MLDRLGHATFADYVYSPEPNAINGPRILIVPRKAPSAPPVLVIEINSAGGHVSVYGPVRHVSASSRIGTDLKRWIDGGEASVGQNSASVFRLLAKRTLRGSRRNTSCAYASLRAHVFAARDLLAQRQPPPRRLAGIIPRATAPRRGAPPGDDRQTLVRVDLLGDGDETVGGFTPAEERRQVLADEALPGQRRLPA